MQLTSQQAPLQQTRIKVDNYPCQYMQIRRQILIQIILKSRVNTIDDNFSYWCMTSMD